jgi:A/G-specific adenine glycosylase
MVSEFMLQQTPVQRVLPVWQIWMERWPTPADLASAKKSDLITAWGRLGYPRRALRLYESAKVISEQFHNEVPGDIESLRTLPGVGEYTAAAIAAFAYNKPTLVLDVNIRRFFARVIDGLQHPTSAPNLSEKALRRELIPEDGAKWAAATMEFGAQVCTSRDPQCEECPFAHQCAWRLSGYPQSEKAQKNQKWHGTDRQCRGTIVQALREKPSLTREEMASLWSEVSQLEKALETLIADGLIEVIGNRYQLAS